MASRKLKEIKSPDEIPEFESESEEHEFWSTHSLSEEFFEKAEPIPEGVLPPPRPRTSPIYLHFDEDVLAQVKVKAARKHKSYQTLLKEFAVERLYEEEKREGWFTGRSPKTRRAPPCGHPSRRSRS